MMLMVMAALALTACGVIRRTQTGNGSKREYSETINRRKKILPQESQRPMRKLSLCSCIMQLKRQRGVESMHGYSP